MKGAQTVASEAKRASATDRDDERDGLPVIGARPQGLHDTVGRLQRTAGNRAVGERLGSVPRHQSSVHISPPTPGERARGLTTHDDPSERQAEEVARQIATVMPDSLLATDGPSIPAATRQAIEPLLGIDLGSVRVHTGAAADASARALGASAYTQGEDVVLGSRREGAGPSRGETMVHELAHVAQQAKGGPSGSHRPVIQRQEADKNLALPDSMMRDHRKSAGGGKCNLVVIDPGKKLVQFHTTETVLAYTLSHCDLPSGRYLAEVSVEEKPPAQAGDGPVEEVTFDFGTGTQANTTKFGFSWIVTEGARTPVDFLRNQSAVPVYVIDAGSGRIPSMRILMMEWRSAGLLDPPHRPDGMPPIPDIPVPPGVPEEGANELKPVLGGLPATPLVTEAPRWTPIVIEGGKGVAKAPIPRIVPLPAAIAGPAMAGVILFWSTHGPEWADEDNPITRAEFQDEQEHRWYKFTLTPDQKKYLEGLRKRGKVPALPPRQLPAPPPAEEKTEPVEIPLPPAPDAESTPRKKAPPKTPSEPRKKAAPAAAPPQRTTKPGPAKDDKDKRSSEQPVAATPPPKTPAPTTPPPQAPTTPKKAAPAPKPDPKPQAPAEPGKKETGKQLEKRLLEEDRKDRAANDEKYFAIEGAKIRTIVEKLEQHLKKMAKQGRKVAMPKINRSILDMKTIELMEAAGIADAWKKQMEALSKRAMDLSKSIREAAGDKRTVERLQRVLTELEAKIDAMRAFEQGLVGDRAPDLVEVFPAESSIVVTDITQATDDPMHNLKTRVYVKIFQKIFEWLDVGGLDYERNDKQKPVE